MTAEQTLYEQVQNQNWLTRFLHSGRYAELLAMVGSIERDLGRRVRVLDIGCGPGSTAKTLLEHYDADYTGIDNDPVFIAAAEAKAGSRPGCRFLTADAADPVHYRPESADLVCALETFEHIPANSVVRIIENVCRIVKPRVFLATVPVEVGPAVWIKNWGSLLMGYDRKSGNFRETFWAGLYRLQKVPPHDISHQGFDWRWLAYTMHSNAPLHELRSMPARFIPRSLAPTMLMVSRPGG
jgi:SAM-dependent methyltransferase